MIYFSAGLVSLMTVREDEGPSDPIESEDTLVLSCGTFALLDIISPKGVCAPLNVVTLLSVEVPEADSSRDFEGIDLSV